jgi:hypothetical protein
MLLVVDPERVDEVLAACEGAGQPGVAIGHVLARSGTDSPRMHITGEVA